MKITSQFKFISVVLLKLVLTGCALQTNDKLYYDSNINYTQEEALVYLSVLPRVNNAIDLRKLTRIPGGSTHNIYKHDGNPTLLLKIMKKSIGKSLEILNSDLNAINHQYEDLYAIFGIDKCLVEYRFIDLIQEPERFNLENAIISVVRFEPAFQNQYKFGLNFSSTERDELKINSYPSNYHLLNMGLMSSEVAYRDFDLEIFLEFESSFRDIFKKIDQNKSLQLAIKDFLIKFKAYYEKTDRFFDLKGEDNVIFYPKTTEWTYKIGSVIKHETGKEFQKMINEISINPHSINSSFEDYTHIFYVPSWIRGLNAIGKKIKLNKTIEYPVISNADSLNLSKIHMFLPLSSRAIFLGKNHQFSQALKFFDEFTKTETSDTTWLRYLLGIRYSEYAKNKNPAQLSKKEIESFLSLLIDHRNKFSTEKYEIVQSAIEELLCKLCYFGHIDPIIKSKAKIMLERISRR